MAASANATIFHFRETWVSCFSSPGAGGAVAIVDVGVSSWRSLSAGIPLLVTIGIVELGTALVVLWPSFADAAKRTLISDEVIELGDAVEVEGNPETAVEGVVVIEVESEVSRAPQALDCVWGDW
jgi:hypothetical protein